MKLFPKPLRRSAQRFMAEEVDREADRWTGPLQAGADDLSRRPDSREPMPIFSTNRPESLEEIARYF